MAYTALTLFRVHWYRRSTKLGHAFAGSIRCHGMPRTLGLGTHVFRLGWATVVTFSSAGPLVFHSLGLALSMLKSQTEGWQHSKAVPTLPNGHRGLTLPFR